MKRVKLSTSLFLYEKYAGLRNQILPQYQKRLKIQISFYRSIIKQLSIRGKSPFLNFAVLIGSSESPKLSKFLTISRFS